MKKILISIDPDMEVTVLCDMTNVKTKSDYEMCLRTVFEKDDFEIDDDDGTEWLCGSRFDEFVDELKSDGCVELCGDGDMLQVIDVSKIKDPLAKTKKKAAKLNR